jgi:hypothetical protein
MHWRTRKKIEALRERGRRGAARRWELDRQRRDLAADRSASPELCAISNPRWEITLRDVWTGESGTIVFRSWRDLQRRLSAAISLAKASRLFIVA